MTVLEGVGTHAESPIGAAVTLAAGASHCVLSSVSLSTGSGIRPKSCRACVLAYSEPEPGKSRTDRRRPSPCWQRDQATECPVPRPYAFPSSMHCPRAAYRTILPRPRQDPPPAGGTQRKVSPGSRRFRIPLCRGWGMVGWRVLGRACSAGCSGLEPSLWEGFGDVGLAKVLAGYRPGRGRPVSQAESHCGYDGGGACYSPPATTPCGLRRLPSPRTARRGGFSA